MILVNVGSKDVLLETISNALSGRRTEILGLSYEMEDLLVLYGVIRESRTLPFGTPTRRPPTKVIKRISFGASAASLGQGVWNIELFCSFHQLWMTLDFQFLGNSSRLRKGKREMGKSLESGRY